jgi:hypothetical protein
MRIWHYDKNSGELAGEGAADPHPIEEGEWLLPAFSTAIAPPDAQAGHAIVWTGSAWSLLVDHRGETWWKADAEFNTEPVTVDFIGDPTERETPLTNVEPPAPPAPPPPPIVVTPRQIRLALNQLGLRAAVESYVAAADQDTKDTWEFATEFERENSMVAIAAEAMGKSPEEVDALFALAKSL